MLGALTRHHTHLVTRRTYRDALISAIATREATPAEAPAAEPPAAAQAPPLEPDPQAERAFRDWARRLHIKYCPSCAAPIEKNGGCHNMSCSNCGETRTHPPLGGAPPAETPARGLAQETSSGGILSRLRARARAFTRRAHTRFTPGASTRDPPT